MRDPGSSTGSEGGAAALAVPAAVVLVVVAGLGLGDLGAVVTARARAQTAADAAALAAAVEIALRGPRGADDPSGSNGPSALGIPYAADGPAAPAEQARRLATANGARLAACRCPASRGTPGAERTVVVEVEVPAPTRLLPGPVRVEAEARADVRSP